MPGPHVPIPDCPGIEIERDTVRRYIAYTALGGFLSIIGVIVLGGLFGRPKTIEETVQLITTTASVLSGVVGAVVGFYFNATSK
jgi:membrane protein DedA with SNARE-associated domain